jgi:molybdopterin adenylyltransferase
MWHFVKTALGCLQYAKGMIRTAILAVNDEGPSSPRLQQSIEVIRKILKEGPFIEVDYQVVPDEQAVIRSRLRILSEGDTVDLVLTTGGTGLTSKERTPDATRDVIEREIPGIAEYMRMMGTRNSPRSLLFRGICGSRRKTLIVNLPGGPRGITDSLLAILEVLPPAVDYVTGQFRSVPKEWQEQ